MKRWAWAAAGVIVLALVTRERKAFAAMTVGFSEFERIGDVYFAPSLGKDERDRMLEMLTEAKRRVSGLYGPLRARPTLIVSDAATMGRFSDTPTAVTHYQPAGAFMAFGPRGQNVDVIAHELAHAELLARVGFRKLVFCVPTWFDEGLAVQFDRRPTHDQHTFLRRVAQGWPVPALSALADHAHFFAGPRSVVRFHYALARVAVDAWLDARSPQRAVQQIEQLDCSQDTARELARISSLIDTR